MRNENARKHCLTVHGDHEKRTVAVMARNKKWTPNVFISGPWTPPPEARMNAKVYRIEIRGGKILSQINATRCKRRISRTNPYLALTPEEALVTIESENISTIGRMNKVQFLLDLNISPSSSTETILQDEDKPMEPSGPKDNLIYRTFKTTRE